MNRLQVALMVAALLPRPAAAQAPLSVDRLTSERQETVCALQLNPETATYKTWGGGSQRRAFADELLPACFGRTLAIEELITDQPVRWVFTGPCAGVTVFIGTNEVRLAHRFYESPGVSRSRATAPSIPSGVGRSGRLPSRAGGRVLLRWAMRHLSGDPEANVVIMGDFNGGQPVGSRSRSQLAKVASSPGGGPRCSAQVVSEAFGPSAP